MDRVILHCDCNSFFASVETVLNPQYRDVPMAVCGSVEDRHGIVLAKNELSKKYGIQTAETVWSAKRKCRDLVIVPPHHEEYMKFSRRVNEIYARYTDLIEPFGIDESWLDVTKSQRIFGTGIEIAESIRKAVKEEIGITVSIGVSFNKVFAKLGSDYKKPDAITVISPENFKEIVYPLPAKDLLFVGKKTESVLLSMGIKTIGELANTTKELLINKLGKMGEMLYIYSNGLDLSPVSPEREDAKSISSGYTFKHNLITREECRAGIDFLSDDIGRKLRANGQVASTVGITVKDEFLKTQQRQKTLSVPTDLGRDIAEVAYELLLNEWDMGKPIRMITVSCSNLEKSSMLSTQISFFDNKEHETKKQKDKEREIAVDIIRQKFGTGSIFNGGLMDNDIGIFEKRKK